MNQILICNNCGKENSNKRYFCEKCGMLLNTDGFNNPDIYEESEFKIKRILENINLTPHNNILFNDISDVYLRKIERYQALINLPEVNADNTIFDKIKDFIDLCTNPEFQIAFVGTIKTGKSTLINSLLGHNYASMAVTPETAALTKFRSSSKDYVKVNFYSKDEWRLLWDSRTSGADAFMCEYNALKAETIKDKWIGHPPIYKEVTNNNIDKELSIWSSSKYPEHYFVKEIEVGISTMPDSIPKQVVFVDTPGLSDPVAYRSEITKQYIRKANAVFVCVDSQKVQKEEIETISSVFSFSSYNKEKVHIIATHWDKLNNPEADWLEQKKWLKSRLVGKGFFDTSEMAEENIIHSAAHIYNLCRDFETITQDENITLMQFALGMKMDINNLKCCIPEMKKKTNIKYIQTLIVEKFAKKYEKLLATDIEMKYKDINYIINRFAKERQHDLNEMITMSKLNIKEMEAKVKKQQIKHDDIMIGAQQLTALITEVEKSTQKRLDEVLSKLKSYRQSGI